MLSVENHDRDVVDLTYVYPVISRRAGGVSLGVNLNPNNACNWQCVYCQVPDLTRGVAPKIDLALLEQELDTFLAQLLFGDYMQKHVPEGCQNICDIAISGNGEPTTSTAFLDVVRLIVKLKLKHALDIPLRLITNGSSVQKPYILAGLKLMAQHGGEIWFKVDAIGETFTQRINGVSLSAAWQQQQLHIAAQACPTWLQTCVMQGQAEDEGYISSYITWLKQALSSGILLHGVLLYGLARPSMQDGGASLQSADDVWMQEFAQKIETLGLTVKVSS